MDCLVGIVVLKMLAYGTWQFLFPWRFVQYRREEAHGSSFSIEYSSLKSGSVGNSFVWIDMLVKGLSIEEVRKLPFDLGLLQEPPKRTFLYILSHTRKNVMFFIIILPDCEVCFKFQI